MIRMFFSLAVAFLTFCSCTHTLAGGSASEGEARISGRVISYTGTAASYTQVVLFASTYDPVKDSADYFIDTTDQFGNYTFAKITYGDYIIVATHIDKRTKAFAGGIHVAGDTLTVPVATLETPGSIKVTLSDSANLLNGYLYIPGTKIFILVTNQNGSVILDSVPVGIIPGIAYSATNTATNQMIRYNIPVISGDTTVVQNSLWKFTRKIMLNTATTGADVAGNVYNFPVLVRLNSSDFNFSQAQNSGIDLRFTKSDNTPLTYEIERWDAVNQLAEIWIKVDTIKGNDSTQFIMMYWGVSTPWTDSGKFVNTESNSTAVFDTAIGFQGVWHLAQAGTAIAKDATPNHFDGSPSDTAPSAVIGMIGNALSFNGKSNYLRMAGTASGVLDFAEKGRYSVSAWVFASVVDSIPRMIAGKGHQQYYLRRARTPPSFGPRWEFVEFHGKAGWQVTDTTATAGEWVYLTGVRNGNSQYLYLNGAVIDSSIDSGCISTAARVTTDDFSIGRYLSNVTFPPDEGVAPFFGMIDEVRVSRVSLGKDWIKLCFMNQKEQDALVVFK